MTTVIKKLLNPLVLLAHNGHMDWKIVRKTGRWGAGKLEWEERGKGNPDELCIDVCTCRFPTVSVLHVCHKYTLLTEEMETEEFEFSIWI